MADFSGHLQKQTVTMFESLSIQIQIQNNNNKIENIPEKWTPVIISAI